MKIIYSSISKSDTEKYNNIIKKIKFDMSLYENLKDDIYIIAIDEGTNKIIAFAGLSNKKVEKEKFVLNNNFHYTINEDYMDNEIIVNLIKIAMNEKRKTGDDLIIVSELWDTYQALLDLGFEIDDQDLYNESLNDRKWLTEDLKECLNRLSSNDKEEALFVKRRYEMINNSLKKFRCLLKINGKKIEKDFVIEDYISFDKLPEECKKLDNVNYKDPVIYDTDDKYNYCELRKTDKDYSLIKAIIADEITTPNLRVNGGKLYAYLGLDFPELLVYLKDKEKDEIVGYVGLTVNYGIGLYISQIAVKDGYKHQGIGSILIREAVKHARDMNIDVVSADISRDNDLSLALFGKYGFKKDGQCHTVNVQEYLDTYGVEDKKM